MTCRNQPPIDLRLHLHVKSDESMHLATSDEMGTNISKEWTGVTVVGNSIYWFAADAVYVAHLPPKKGIRAFMAKYIIAAATAWDVLSGAAGNWFARATDTGRRDS